MFNLGQTINKDKLNIIFILHILTIALINKTLGKHDCLKYLAHIRTIIVCVVTYILQIGRMKIQIQFKCLVLLNVYLCNNQFVYGRTII